MNSTTRSAVSFVTAIALGAWMSSGACADPVQARDTGSNNAATPAVPGGAHAAASGPVSRYLAPGEGKNYEWGQDHIFVKLSSAETGGLATVIEDNLKPGFKLGRHLHRKHTEIFYILDGEVEFTVGDKSFMATAGAVIYLPPGTPHAVKSPKGGKMLMFYTPGGFDEMLTEISEASLFQRFNPLANARRNEKYDHVDLE